MIIFWHFSSLDSIAKTSSLGLQRLIFSLETKEFSLVVDHIL